MRTRVRCWRRQGYPLRRRSDVVETWTALVAAVLLMVGAPLAGALSGLWAHQEARSMTAEQRAERHRVSAQVVGRPPEALPTVAAGRQRTYPVTVRWAEPGVGERTATARVPTGTAAGDRVTVWLDDSGHAVPPPRGATTVWQHTLTVGTCAAIGSAGAVLLGHAAVRRAALRRRLAEWERDWARTEPLWTRRDA
ncbi:MULTISPECIES: Rv1733c family protein [unclassified Streptomyces]|uniref:Rv1733c family protein n=1 Tax=unclassified Streptomyces TaxID=2593676 RepID=UPI003D71BB64